MYSVIMFEARLTYLFLPNLVSRLSYEAKLLPDKPIEDRPPGGTSQ